ncbi:hypothetical protein [Agrobacterium vitis]|uniref:hypothetical protein n=1 Tax=Agrobacterium vitis TaxID=373 RepID=UPI0012E94516|nr:hypothetical protein [Agrobacterium vitis]MVA19484.1 hypothetical protein [Agrobacterium vitis]MVA23608.1 hypothetical protein [Agrobacterium vitis]MVA27034.1 hypothetical protein [Agrobacterium vitis]MVA40693.1 hypothetical protein [Agrobacterium vitis]NSX96970.1 hypothetical protein [Agrobacterium vitis]
MPTETDLPPLPPQAQKAPSGLRYREQYGVILVCEDEDAQERLYGALADIKKSKIKVVVT